MSRVPALLRLLGHVVDSAIPASMDDPERLRRARIVLSFTLVLLLLGLEAIVFFSWALPAHLSSLVGLSLAMGLALALAIPAVLRRWGALELGANLIIAGSYLVIVSTLTVVGGIRAPLLHWLALPPMLAMLMGAPTSARVWVAIGLATMVTLTALDASGLRFPDELSLATLEGPLLWAQRFVDVGSWIGILVTITLLYETHRAQQTRQLAEKNQLLESEIAQRVHAEERTRYLAYYDELTTLPNRRLFEQHLQTALALVPRLGRQVGVLFVDLDGFKVVNDSHGHALGDQLLQQVARRLKSCIRGSDIASRDVDDPHVVSRLGGDEFTILLPGIRDHREAALVAQRILDCMDPAFPLGDHEVFITASVGVAMHPSSGEDAESLLRSADLAMYHAKDCGKNTFKFFEESMNRDMVRHSTLAADLRRGLGRGEFEVYFQPIVEARGHALVGVEALARWNHPEHGAVSPVEFIEVAEKSGQIVSFGEWILRDACRTYSKWAADGVAPPRFAVNVSGLEFRQRTFVATVLRSLQLFAIDPHCLELEVTEGVMLADEDEASRSLSLLKAEGVRVALDDFGTGYSSLSYVKRFPVDSLKIDRSFIAEVETDPEAQAIVTAIIAMAHQLGLEVVGEGVETEAQERFLQEHGCDELQGYRFGRPMDRESMTRRLAGR